MKQSLFAIALLAGAVATTTAFAQSPAGFSDTVLLPESQYEQQIIEAASRIQQIQQQKEEAAREEAARQDSAATKGMVGPHHMMGQMMGTNMGQMMREHHMMGEHHKMGDNLGHKMGEDCKDNHMNHGDMQHEGMMHMGLNQGAMGMNQNRMGHHGMMSGGMMSGGMNHMMAHGLEHCASGKGHHLPGELKVSGYMGRPDYALFKADYDQLQQLDDAVDTYKNTIKSLINKGSNEVIMTGVMNKYHQAKQAKREAAYKLNKKRQSYYEAHPEALEQRYAQ